MKFTNNNMQLQEKHDGGTARNARIRIDYQGLKPNVQFSYPSIRDQVVGSMYSTIRLQIFFGYLFAFILMYSINLITFGESPSEYIMAQQILKRSYWLVFGMVVSYLVISPLVYFPFKKFWDKMYPSHQARTQKKKIALFYPKDIKYDYELGYYCEIPVFSNIVCNYEATGEFSKYLYLFEIQEHKFKYQTASIGASDINEWLWYARFYLKEKPKTGTLEVIFK